MYTHKKVVMVDATSDQPLPARFTFSTGKGFDGGKVWALVLDNKPKTEMQWTILILWNLDIFFYGVPLLKTTMLISVVLSVLISSLI